MASTLCFAGQTLLYSSSEGPHGSRAARAEELEKILRNLIDIRKFVDMLQTDS
jgi:hypothetical protein